MMGEDMLDRYIVIPFENHTAICDPKVFSSRLDAQTASGQ
jgi:hypothetical protein